MDEKVSHFYDEWAQKKAEDETHEPVIRWKAREFSRMLREVGMELDGRVLEIGCAEGILLSEFQKIFPEAEYNGVDISQEFVDRGRRRFPSLNLQRGDYRDVLQKEGQFDFIIASDLLEHLPDDDAFLREVLPHCDYFLLKLPLEICVYDSNPWVWTMRKLVGKTDREEFGPDHVDGHLRGYTVATARELVRRHELENIAESVQAIQDFYDRSSVISLIQKVSERLCVHLFGGTFFAVTASQAATNDAGRPQGTLSRGVTE